MAVYYNEHDPFAAAWLRALIRAGHIASGEVDTRSIEDVLPSDLAGFIQCHFFAGIGVWSYALRQAGWPDDRPVWTGSCPCQPFSAAGKGGGFADERHLWPAFHHLICQCRPANVLGEQVASRDGLAWLDLVQADMEAAGYACGAVDTCAAGVGAPHIRQRLYWCAQRLADAASWDKCGIRQCGQAEGAVRQTGGHRTAFGLADADSNRCREGEWNDTPSQHRDTVAAKSNAGGLGDAQRAGLEGHAGHGDGEAGRAGAPGPTAAAGGPLRPGPVNGHWRNADWLFCRDGRFRPVEPGTFPLAHGTAQRVGRLRGYGNALCAPQAQAFIGACMAMLGE